MRMFIQRNPAALFAWTFIETQFISAATANRTLMALIYTIEMYLKSTPCVLFIDISF